MLSNNKKFINYSLIRSPYILYLKFISCISQAYLSGTWCQVYLRHITNIFRTSIFIPDISQAHRKYIHYLNCISNISQEYFRYFLGLSHKKYCNAECTAASLCVYCVNGTKQFLSANIGIICASAACIKWFLWLAFETKEWNLPIFIVRALLIYSLYTSLRVAHTVNKLGFHVVRWFKTRLRSKVFSLGKLQ